MSDVDTAGFEQKTLREVMMASVVEHRRSRRWGIFFKALIIAYIFFVTFAMLYKGAGVSTAPNKYKEHVGLIDLEGVIGSGHDIEADDVVASLRAAFDAENIKGLILRINSPGGMPVQSAYVYDEIMRLRQKRPELKVHAVIADVGASGAYYIASAADQIYANPSSLVGSIGVLMVNYGVSELANKIGVEQRTLTEGINKNMLDPMSPKNEKQIAYVKSTLDNVHQHFITAVKDGRGDRLDKTRSEEIFSGLFWSGQQAKELGLVDAFGSAGYVAREVIGVDEIIDYSVKPNFIDLLSSKMNMFFNKTVKSLLSEQLQPTLQ